MQNQENAYQELIRKISETCTQGQKQAVLAVNNHLIDTYWKVGQYIVEFEQKGAERAIYGKGLLENLSKDLSLLHGKGFSLSNMKRMRQFYLAYPIGAKPSHQLSWSHYIELLKMFVSKYQFYLPDKEELRALVNKQLYQND